MAPEAAPRSARYRSRCRRRIFSSRPERGPISATARFEHHVHALRGKSAPLRARTDPVIGSSFQANRIGPVPAVLKSPYSRSLAHAQTGRFPPVSARHSRREAMIASCNRQQNPPWRPRCRRLRVNARLRPFALPFLCHFFPGFSVFRRGLPSDSAAQPEPRGYSKMARRTDCLNCSRNSTRIFRPRTRRVRSSSSRCSYSW